MNEFNEYVRECFSEAGEIVIKSMMGGYLVYFNGKLIGDICGDELFLKRTPTSDRLLADSELRYPYEESKTLMHVFDSFDDKELIQELLNGMYAELPEKKTRKPDENGKKMRIINLVENELGESGCEAAHGLSFYIETENHKLLFDAGPNNVVLKNAQKLGVDLGFNTNPKNGCVKALSEACLDQTYLTAIDTVILSHGHYDHSGGILPFAEINPRAKIYMQQNAGGEYYAFDGEEKGYRYIGIDKKILSLPQVQLLKGDTKIDDELQLFTVEKRAWPLPSTNKRLRELCNGQYVQDEFHHEQNLLLTAGGKKILFCGCAHNGILNVMETLERKFGSAMLPDLVIGGFHLMKRTEFSEADTAEVTEIANRLKVYKAHFATCHCTGFPVFNQMKEIMGDQLSHVRSGDEVVVE